MYKVHETINMYEAKTHFSEIINAVTEGKEVMIARAGKPVAKLVPLKPAKRKVRYGLLKGKMRIADDFDAPLPDDIIDLFEGNNAPLA